MTIGKILEGYGIFVLIALYVISHGDAHPGIPDPNPITLPVTQHSDGHYYDANGRLVS